MKKIFVVCEEAGKYSGRLLANHLRRRLEGKIEVHRGDRKRLQRNLAKGNVYMFILNEGAIEGHCPGRARVFNEISMARICDHRKFFRMKMGLKKIPAPLYYNKPHDVTEADLPVFGRTTFPDGGKDLWPCYELADIKKAVEEGATHFTERLADCREFKVHVVCTKPNVRLAKNPDFSVIKISERRSESKQAQELNPALKSLNSAWVWGAVLDKRDSIIGSLELAAKLTMKEMGVHWGSVTLLVGKDGIPKVIKLDARINIQEDKVGTMARYSNAICKLIGEDPKPLVFKRPTSA
jgi:hypothetical protein